MVFSCNNLTCERGGRVVFQNLGFTLQPGGFLLLKGANGTGKTTLIKTLAGLLPPAQGEVTWHGVPVARSHDFRKELTYVGHKNAVKLECTVGENLAFWARLYDRDAFIGPALKYWGLAGKEEIPCFKLSSGWQRRVALARLLISPTQLWMLDEPTNFLDQEAIALMGSLIESRVTMGGIVIAASHTMNSAISTHLLHIEDFAPQGARNEFWSEEDAA